MLTQTEALRERSREFAVRVLRFVKKLPRDRATEAVARQLARSGAGASSNYPSACRARSRAEFIAKLGIVEEEADESLFWLEVMVDSNLVTKPRVERLLAEADQLTAIIVASVKTARR